jgi:apolipoprotein N-acyltransferase
VQGCTRSGGVPPPLAAIGRLACLFARLAGWRRCVAALLAGGVSVLALAPFFLSPVLFLTLPVLVWLIDGACGLRAEPATALPVGSAREVRRRWRSQLAAAHVGWWFGFGYFLAGLFWISEAFLVDARTFAVLLPFAVTLLPAAMALFFAAAAGLASRLWLPGARRVLVLALAISATEWLRGHVLSGFPWNVIGYALTYPLALMQSAAYLGVYALSLCAVLVFALPAVLWGAAGGRGARRWLALAVAVLPLSVAFLLGQLRLAGGGEAIRGVRLRIVQPNVPERDKWRPENQDRIFRDLLALSHRGPAGESDGAVGITHIVWPEAALPFLVLERPDARAAIGDMLPPGAVLITGALRAEPAPAGSPASRRIFNSILVLGAGGTLVAEYDKIRLVPFGEYLPLQGALEALGLRQLTRLRGGFTPGERPRRLLNVPGLTPLVPLICYEAIFPADNVAVPDRPLLLLNVTNDAWFGDTTGPRQHFHQARVRAVEEGVALLRVANNGISALVDGKGRVGERLGLNQQGTRDARLPAPLPPPPYARCGDAIFLLIWLCGAAALIRPRKRRRAAAPQGG